MGVWVMIKVRNLENSRIFLLSFSFFLPLFSFPPSPYLPPSFLPSFLTPSLSSFFPSFPPFFLFFFLLSFPLSYLDKHLYFLLHSAGLGLPIPCYSQWNNFLCCIRPETCKLLIPCSNWQQSLKQLPLWATVCALWSRRE